MILDHFRIKAGYMGPTDCCYILDRNGVVKEYLIESQSWRALSYIDRFHSDATIIPSNPAWDICKFVWDYGGDDERHPPDMNDGIQTRHACRF